MPKQYKYKDWWEGKICLAYSSLSYNSKELPEPIIVDWKDFAKGDVKKIQKKQIELVQHKIESKSDELQQKFYDKFERSRLKKQFLGEEIRQIKEIFVGNLAGGGDIYFTTNWGISFEKRDLWDIQAYFKKVIKAGAESNCHYMQSPECKYQEANKIPFQIYAEVLWDYHEFLVALKKQIENKIATLKEKKVTEEKNPYEHIFVNVHAYKFFMKLKENTVKSSTYVANYSYIYHKLINKNLGAIWSTVRPSDFCKFLETEMEVAFSPRKLPYNNSNTNSAAFNILLAEYKNDIEKNNT